MRSADYKSDRDGGDVKGDYVSPSQEEMITCCRAIEHDSGLTTTHHCTAHILSSTPSCPLASIHCCSCRYRDGFPRIGRRRSSSAIHPATIPCTADHDPHPAGQVHPSASRGRSSARDTRNPSSSLRVTSSSTRTCSLIPIAYTSSHCC